MTSFNGHARPGRTVLFLAYYFPPLGGGGVQRSLAFTRFLPELGYDPVVVTGPGADAVQWGPVDGTLEDRLRDGLRVVRAEGPEPERTRGWRCRAERWLRIEEPFSRWWVESAVAAARQVEGADLVYASMSPFESGRAAARIAEEAGLPWIADLRDPWALDDWLVFPTGLHRRLELRTMRRTLASASLIIMNTPDSAAALVRHAPELRGTPIVTITNGFDPSEFEGEPAGRATGRFHVVHAGHVHTRRESGATRLGRRLSRGAAAGLDTFTRSHAYLVEALELLLARRPELADVITVELVGSMTAADREALPPQVAALGYLPHRETIAALRSADLLFLPMHDLARGLRSRIVPGKLYEYLAAGPPILAAVPDGDAREILQAAGNADLCRPADAGAISAALERRVDDWLAGVAPPVADPDVLARFDRRRLTRDLATSFDAVLGDQAELRASPSLTQPTPREVSA